MAFPTYGELLLNGYGEQPESAVIRTDMETGPPKQAKVRSRQMVARPLRIRYTNAEYAQFRAWFEGAECNRGASWFDWTDPRDDTLKQARIVGGAYRADASSAGEGAPVAWVVSLTLETWE